MFLKCKNDFESIGINTISSLTFYITTVFFSFFPSLLLNNNKNWTNCKALMFYSKSLKLSKYYFLNI